MRLAFIGIAVAATIGFVTDRATAAPQQHFELNKGDHVCFIGNTLAERMQHFGWLETYLDLRYPSHNLVFRNLGYSGDEINGYRDLHSRMRSMDFGSQDQWLAGEAPIPQPQKLNKDFCLLRIQRIVCRPGWARQIQKRSGPLHQAHVGTAV